MLHSAADQLGPDAPHARGLARVSRVSPRTLVTAQVMPITPGTTPNSRSMAWTIMPSIGRGSGCIIAPGQIQLDEPFQYGGAHPEHGADWKIELLRQLAALHASRDPSAWFPVASP